VYREKLKQKRGEKQEQEQDKDEGSRELPAGEDGSVKLNRTSVGGYDNSNQVTSTDQSNRNSKTKSRVKVSPVEDIDNVPLREPLLDDL